MKEQIYQNGFYAMIGLILGIVSMFVFDKPCPCQIENDVKDIKCDTVLIHDTVTIEKNVVTLNESNVLKELKKQNVHHSNVVLAQAKLESGNFTSSLTKTHNNFLGIKKNGNYAKYDTWQDCITDYKDRVQNKYKGGNYFKFLTDIGYAEDPKYIISLKEIVG